MWICWRMRTYTISWLSFGYHWLWLDMDWSGFFLCPKESSQKNHLGHTQIPSLLATKIPRKNPMIFPSYLHQISPRISPSIFTICAMVNSWIQLLHLVKLGMLISQCSKGFILYIYIVHVHIHIHIHIYTYIYIYISWLYIYIYPWVIYIYI